MDAKRERSDEYPADDEPLNSLIRVHQDANKSLLPYQPH